MKNFVLTFLVLVMLTPSLVCAMPYCEPSSENSELPANISCAEHKSNQERQKTDEGALMADCMGLDFQKVEATSIDVPNFKLTSVAYIELYSDANLQDDLMNSVSIRAPPDNTLANLYQVPTLLKTQRIRL